MNPTWEDPIGDEEDEENAFDKGFFRGRDAVIFLVDATWPMFEASANEDSEMPFRLSLKCARTTLTNKIISSPKDLTGIVFFGTASTKNARNNTDFKHVYIFQELGEPGAERVLEAEELMNVEHSVFNEKYGHSSDFSLADALWVCSIMFSNCKYTLAHRRILLFTATDHPHEGDNQLLLNAKTKAKDLHESGIDIDLLHIRISERGFDPSLFYKDICLTAEDETYKFPDASDKFDDLLTRVRCKEHRKRPLGNLEFNLGKDVKLALKMYKLVVPTSKPVPVKLSKENNAELTSMSSLFLVDTNEILLPSDLMKFQEYGGKRIYVTEDEVKQIRRFDNPGLLLLGFKPKSCLKIHYHIKSSMFLYPDEKSIEGSCRLSSAMIIQCQNRDVVPICRLIARKNDPPKLVALLPQMEQVDERGLQVSPPGFHVVYLPFEEDIRCTMNDNVKKHSPPEVQVEKAKEIIKKLQFAFYPEAFENPVLQKHWRNIEALALNRDAPEEIVDYTLPTKNVIEQRAGKLIDDFKALLCPSSTDMSGSYGNPSKKPKLEDSMIPDDLRNDLVMGQLPRYKVNILKEFCKKKLIRCGTKKADIIDAIKAYYEQQPVMQ